MSADEDKTGKGAEAGEPVITDAELRLKVDELEMNLKKATDELKDFRTDADERAEAEIKALRREINSAVEDPDVYSYNEIQSMSRDELLVARRLLLNARPADRGGSVSTGKKDFSGDSDIEYRHGQAFSKVTIGEMYKPVTLNPIEEKKK